MKTSEKKEHYIREHTEGRRRTSGARLMGIKGEGERGHTARQPGRTNGSRQQDKPRGHNRRHTAATEHTTDSRSGRKQRDQTEKRYDIFKGERREKRR